jgi:hypothetical protein
MTMRRVSSWLLLVSAGALAAAFAPRAVHPGATRSAFHGREAFLRLSMASPTTAATASKGFAKTTANSVATPAAPTATDPETAAADLATPPPLHQVKEDLLQLLASTTGQASDFRQVEEAVNRLESEYQPIQTLDFLNLMQQGRWQLLFSTQLTGTPNPQKFRLRALTQDVDCQQTTGNVTAQALWDLAEEGDGQFLCSGTFRAWHSYEITQGARVSLQLDDHVLELSPGSAVPADVPALVGLLHRSMPAELFDASQHSADTTYLDDSLRIVRYTGSPRLEGVRDIFLRETSLQNGLKQEVDDDVVDEESDEGLF